VRVTITHPHHPLYGQQVEGVRIRRGADPDLIIQLPNGLHAAIAMSWTDYVARSEPDPEHSSLPSHLLDLDGLRQAAQLIERIFQDGRYPTADAQARACPPRGPSYD